MKKTTKILMMAGLFMGVVAVGTNSASAYSYRQAHEYEQDQRPNHKKDHKRNYRETHKQDHVYAKDHAKKHVKRHVKKHINMHRRHHVKAQARKHAHNQNHPHRYSGKRHSHYVADDCRQRRYLGRHLGHRQGHQMSYAAPGIYITPDRIVVHSRHVVSPRGKEHYARHAWY
ncbi:MAG: hypothetical protein JKY45_11395 [Emcibacter sp.]|nr:hypothetical protein [Emcibacter sp.]